MSRRFGSDSRSTATFDSDSFGRESFFGTLGSRTGVADVAALLSVPAVLWFAFLWPVGVRRSLAFEYTDPSLLTSFASNFVHLDGGHLLVNLAVVRPAFAVGFSGITMAFVGYLPFALADYVEVNFDVGPASAVAPALFFLGLALISVLSVRSVLAGDTTLLAGTGGLVLAALLSALLYAVAAYDRGEQFRARLAAAVGVPGCFEALVVGLLLVMAFPFVAFPADPASGTGALNLYVHLLGYALGFIVMYTTAETVGGLFAESPL